MIYYLILGLDDSKNIARILLRLASDGCNIKTNSRIKDNMNIIGSRNGDDDSNQENRHY